MKRICDVEICYIKYQFWNSDNDSFYFADIQLFTDSPWKLCILP